jgi:hypothetical protein
LQNHWLQELTIRATKSVVQLTWDRNGNQIWRVEAYLSEAVAPNNHDDIRTERRRGDSPPFFVAEPSNVANMLQKEETANLSISGFLFFF